MGKNNFFDFKQFRIFQEKSAMKVGIDGVLLGAWVNLVNSNRILDVGTGTGLIALMAAQRTDASIDAVEIENEAAKEARLNFENSPWSNRLTVINLAFQDFQATNKYDHIISNPPFFENSLKSKKHGRTLARHSDSLSLKELLPKAKSILSENGKLSLILPVEKEKQIFQLANETGLFVSRKCTVHPFETKKPNRLLVELVTMPCEILKSKISIRDEETKSYSEEFKSLTNDFYLSLK